MILHSVDNIYMMGSALPIRLHDWLSLKKIDANTKIHNNLYRKTWSSLDPNNIRNDQTFGYYSIMPISIPATVGVTKITGSFIKNNNIIDHLKSGNEEKAIVDITIDWINNTVKGIYQIIRYDGNIYSKTTNSFTDGGVFKGTPASIQIVNNIQGLSRQDPIFTLSGRNITALPLFGILSSFTYIITNYIYVEKETLAYTTNSQSSTYTSFDIDTLNTLRTAYENLRISHDDLLSKLKETGIIT